MIPQSYPLYAHYEQTSAVFAVVGWLDEGSGAIPVVVRLDNYGGTEAFQAVSDRPLAYFTDLAEVQRRAQAAHKRPPPPVQRTFGDATPAPQTLGDRPSHRQGNVRQGASTDENFPEVDD